MLENANQDQTQTETEVVETPAAQPDNQGGDSPSETQEPAAGAAPQGVHSQQSPMIPKYRFDEVNHRAQAAEARLRDLLAQSQQQPQSAPQAPKQEDFATYEDYIRADARFVAQQEARQAYAAERQRELQAAQAQAEQTRAQAAESNWSRKTSEGLAKHPDFFEVIAQVRVNSHLEQLIKASAVGDELGYHLGKNKDVEARLNAMHPLDAAAELGRIEAKLQGAGGQPQAKVSQMPKPMQPVGTGKAGGAKETGVNRALSLLYPS